VQQIHVAVGVLNDASGRILIAKRSATAHQGDLWEFPGGKLEPGESVQQALARELHEELDIRCDGFAPVIKIQHDYGDQRVLLDVHRVLNFTGRAIGKEGQPLRWVPASELNQYQFPAANYPIVNALQLPHRLLITGHFNSPAECLNKLEAALAQGIKLIQLRAPKLQQHAFADVAQQVIARCRSAGAKVIVNADAPTAIALAADGVHLTGQRLAALAQRPPELSDVLVGGSCHNAEGIHQANTLGLDYIVLSPVEPTATHPQAKPLGWAAFAELTSLAKMPVYALGGMTENHLPLAQQWGGQGIAGISAWWPAS